LPLDFFAISTRYPRHLGRATTLAERRACAQGRGCNAAPQALNAVARQAKRSPRRALEEAMIRFVFRFVGMLLLALAFIFVVYDGIRWISDGLLLVTKTDYVWNTVHDGSLQAFQTLVEKRIGPEVWKLGIVPILELPAAAVACILGVILIVIGRKKKPLIGYIRE
jgi:hypothetical protein